MRAHGTVARYVVNKCRCQPCRTAACEYERRRLRQVAYGRWQPYVDAEPARQHVRALMASGIGWMRVADLAGVSRGGLSKLLYGETKRNLAPSKRIRPETERRLLSVQPLVADRRLVDARRTVQLVRAMQARGYTLTWICEQVGITNQRLLYRTKVRASTARKVAGLIDQCATTPGPSSRAVRRAKENGWTAAALWSEPVPLHPVTLPVPTRRVAA